MKNNLNKKLHYVQSEHNPQAMEELKQAVDWKPVNPCITCSMKNLNDCDYPDEHCERKYIQNVKTTAQKQLLGYQIAHEHREAYINKYKSMLKELEESNG